MIEYRLHVIGKYLSKHNPDLGEMFLPKLLSSRKADRDKALRSRELSGLRKALEGPLLDPIALAVSDILGQSYQEARIGLLRELISELESIPEAGDQKLRAAYSFEPFLATWMSLHMVKRSIGLVQEGYIDMMVESPGSRGVMASEEAALVRSQLPSISGIVDRCVSFFGTFKINLRKSREDLESYISAMSDQGRGGSGWMLSFKMSLADAARNSIASIGNLQENLDSTDSFAFCYQPPTLSRKEIIDAAKKGCRIGAVTGSADNARRLLENADLCVADGAWRMSKSERWDWYTRQYRDLRDSALNSIEAYPPTLETLSSGSILAAGSGIAAAAVGALIGGGAALALRRARA